jgi:hypothetical protein
VLKRIGISALVAAIVGWLSPTLNEFMKDEPGWRGYGHADPPFPVAFTITFVAVFSLTYLVLWWHRED